MSSIERQPEEIRFQTTTSIIRSTATVSTDGDGRNGVPIIALDVTLTGDAERMPDEFRRNKRQLDALTPALRQLPADGRLNLPAEWKYACYKVKQETLKGFDEPVFQDYLYLFNVIVAMEWRPSPRYLRELETTFQRASNFLYDVTDGYMALGQVIVGGPELMDCADIQITASNRLNPRAWVSGLHEAAKYMPIRLGRAIWHKNNRVSIGWEEPEGYRTLVHEWGHYGLNLRDQYLETHHVALPDKAGAAEPVEDRLVGGAYTLVIPGISLAEETIMASLEGNSELVPSHRGGLATTGSHEWQVLAAQYGRIDPNHTPLDGPAELPLPLPSFRPTIEPASEDEPILRDFPKGLVLEHCWVYLVQGSLAAPQRIIAQGTLDARAGYEGFRLLGAEAGDTLVLIGADAEYTPVVLWSTITAIAGGCKVTEWHDATPLFPLVDVIPEPLPTGSPEEGQVDWRLTRIKLHLTSVNGMLPPAGQEPQQVWLFPLGAERTVEPVTFMVDNGEEWTSDAVDVSSLDGHILVRCGQDSFVICSYSQGGGPASSIPTGPPPISAGSSEGNLMLFFEDREPGRDYSSTRVVTTLVHGIAGNAVPAQGGATPRGYTFSLCGNEPLPANLNPTLILNYDRDAASEGGDLLIYRYNPCGPDGPAWSAIPTYLPPGSAFAAAPLDHETAPALIGFRAAPRIERYRLFRRG